VTSPAVEAIRREAMKHISTRQSLSSQLSTMKRIYREQDWMWIQSMKSLEEQIAVESAQASQASRDAREIAMEENNGGF